jgi:hypothetical protein
VLPLANMGVSLEQLETINKSFLEKMNLAHHQYIAFVHQNTAHKHIHLYVNRIDYTGKAYDDQFISNRSAHLAESIAKDMGLKTAKQIQQGKSKQRELEHPEIHSIKELAKATLREPGVNSIPNFVAAFNQAGSQAGFHAEAYLNKQGAFQGLRFYAGEHKFKASEIDRSLSKQNIENHFEHIQQISYSRKKENYLQVNGPSMASVTLDLLTSLMSTGVNTNRYTAIQPDDENEEENERKLQKKRGFAMGM